MKRLTLRKITWEMYEAFVRLGVREDQQRYVRDSRYTLAEAFLNQAERICDTEILPIFAEETMIGYVAIQYFRDGADAWYDLHRFMIDAGQQGRGYGKTAFAMILDYIRTCPMGAADRIKIEYREENAPASHIYHQQGFADSDAYNRYGERAAWLKI